MQFSFATVFALVACATAVTIPATLEERVSYAPVSLVSSPLGRRLTLLNSNKATLALQDFRLLVGISVVVLTPVAEQEERDAVASAKYWSKPSWELKIPVLEDR